jgi:predicted house-cleaning noncanonical NTP pyrophosphatase (MazG superfamily)
MIRYDKLVRDRIPEIIRQSGKMCTVRVLDDGEYVERLKDKLGEELAEFRSSGGVEELADLVEVVQALIEQQGLTWDEFEHRRNAKRQERGGFARRLLLETVRDEANGTDLEGTGRV